MWLKIVTENYCKQLFAKRIEVDGNNDAADDRNDIGEESLIANTRNLDMNDVQKILLMMPNQCYRKLNVCGCTNDKTINKYSKTNYAMQKLWLA